jgi:hypothetical protein
MGADASDDEIIILAWQQASNKASRQMNSAVT